METNLSEQSTDIANRPTIVFTNFWDANAAVRDGYLLTADKDGEHYKVNLIKNSVGKPENFEVYSIALQHPALEQLPHIEEAFGFLHTVDIMCPTYDILMAHKKGGTWEQYTEDFMELIKTRKKEISSWVEELDRKIYLLCCWENTSGKANCHRQLLYDAFMRSKFIQSKANVFYRHGGKKDIKVGESAQTVNMGEQGTEVENQNVTKLKKLGLINDAPRSKRQDNIHAINGEQSSYLLSFPLSAPYGSIVGTGLISSAQSGSIRNNVDDLFSWINENNDDDDRLF